MIADARAPTPTFIEQAQAEFRKPRMSSAARFALIRDPENPHARPVAYGALPDLVAAIHRERRGEAIIPTDAPVEIFGEAAPRKGVSIIAEDAAGRCRYLGWVYLDGQGAAALSRALRAARPDMPVIGKAA